jgi:hypothetical protein
MVTLGLAKGGIRLGSAVSVTPVTVPLAMVMN